jgi:hypothetical protein
LVPLNFVISGVVLLALIMFFPFIMLAVVYQLTNGKMLCGIVSKGKPLKFRMLKLIDGEFVKEGNDKWFIREKQVKLVNYPIMFPKVLGFMTRVVPCELVTPGRAEPLDWQDPTKGVMSSKELDAVLDPHWLRGFVLGVVNESGGGKSDKQMRMFTMLAVALGAICMVLLFVLMTRLNQTNAAIKALQSLLKVSGK